MLPCTLPERTEILLGAPINADLLLLSEINRVSPVEGHTNGWYQKGKGLP